MGIPTGADDAAAGRAVADRRGEGATGRQAAADAGPLTGPDPRDEEWRSRFGAHWRIELLLLGVLVFVAGAAAPLGDPDLGMHLATGEWIVRHGTVPSVEPFAWTRHGAPFYSYSWSLEVLYYLVVSVVGPIGLHLLNGLFVVGSAASIVVLGRVAGWRVWTTIAMATLNLSVASIIAASLRPQLLLFTFVPLAWAAAYRVLDADRIRWPAAGLFALSAAAANTHLFFVLTAAPWSLLFFRFPVKRRRAAALILAVVAGWLASPHALLWPEVFKLYFAPNALIAQPSPIQELQPGFFFALAAPGALLIIVLGLTLLPWALSGLSLTGRERLGHAALWLAGLVAFAHAVRGMAVWWLLTIPTAALALSRVSGPISTRARRANKIAMYAMFLLFAVQRTDMGADELREDWGAPARTVTSETSRWLDPVAAWLDCWARPQGEARIHTIFNFGSYLTWRLPHYSPSIDGRTLFPDSVATAETYRQSEEGTPNFGPWRSADLAILPTRHALASVLDTADGWHRVAVRERVDRDSTVKVGLWVRDRWWSRAGAIPLPGAPTVIRSRPGARETCARTGLPLAGAERTRPRSAG